MYKNDIDPTSLPTKDLHQYIIGAIAPRPIAFVSTINSEGLANVAPYSFFNAFSSNPPIVVFSSNRRVSNNTTKDTLHNVMTTGECVINVVSYAIVRQMALASVEFGAEISEFEKIGLTPEKSKHVSPPRVLESPVNFECRVKDIITLGEHGGAGHLIICEVIHIGINPEIMDEHRIDPHKLDLMGRLGRNWYVRASGNALFELHQGVLDNPLGWDKLPDYIKTNKYLTGNEIAEFAAMPQAPTQHDLQMTIEAKQLSLYNNVESLINLAKQEIELKNLSDAWSVLYYIHREVSM